MLILLDKTSHEIRKKSPPQLTLLSLLIPKSSIKPLYKSLPLIKLSLLLLRGRTDSIITTIYYPVYP
jgi:hypothetical protein